MAFDEKAHEIDPATGFAVHKGTDRRVGIDPVPHVSTHGDPEWPKWVKPHPSHVVRQGDRVSTPAFPLFHVNRADQEVMVLVHDAEEEARAAADVAKKAEPEPEPEAGAGSEHEGEVA